MFVGILFNMCGSCERCIVLVVCCLLWVNLNRLIVCGLSVVVGLLEEVFMCVFVYRLICGIWFGIVCVWFIEG